MEELRWKPKAVKPELKTENRINVSCCVPIPQTPAEIIFDAWCEINKSLFQAFGIIFGLRRT